MEKSFNFLKAYEIVLKKEGGLVYTNDPYDKGGETFAGITRETATRFGYPKSKSMQDMPEEIVKDIYNALFWNKLKCDSIPNYNIALALYEMGVNCGARKAGTIFQKAINILNYNKKTGRGFFNDIEEDGLIGENTLKAFKQINQNRILLIMNALLAKHYIDITQNRRKNRKFVYGWIKNRVKI